MAKLTAIACHASTEDAEEEIQDEFDEQLDEEIRTTHQHDDGGKPNPRVREDKTGRERPMGTQDYGCSNNNIEDFLTYVWEITSPDSNTFSQIDNVIINQK